jgi:hypothetical protein
MLLRLRMLPLRSCSSPSRATYVLSQPALPPALDDPACVPILKLPAQRNANSTTLPLHSTHTLAGIFHDDSCWLFRAEFLYGT